MEIPPRYSEDSKKIIIIMSSVIASPRRQQRLSVLENAIEYTETSNYKLVYTYMSKLIH